MAHLWLVIDCRNAVKTALINKGVLDESGVVVIAGLTNSYSSYITTFEEYQIQRYEAASTIFGPHTLEGYIQKFVELAGERLLCFLLLALDCGQPYFPYFLVSFSQRRWLMDDQLMLDHPLLTLRTNPFHSCLVHSPSPPSSSLIRLIPIHFPRSDY